MKITVCKHSAARTAMEQAADCGPMFKSMKGLVKSLENPHSATNSIYHKLCDDLLDLENRGWITGPGRVLRLLAHKKKQSYPPFQSCLLPLYKPIVSIMSKRLLF